MSPRPAPRRAGGLADRGGLSPAPLPAGSWPAAASRVPAHSLTTHVSVENVRAVPTKPHDQGQSWVLGEWPGTQGEVGTAGERCFGFYQHPSQCPGHEEVSALAASLGPCSYTGPQRTHREACWHPDGHRHSVVLTQSAWTGPELWRFSQDLMVQAWGPHSDTGLSGPLGCGAPAGTD